MKDFIKNNRRVFYIGIFICFLVIISFVFVYSTGDPDQPNLSDNQQIDNEKYQYNINVTERGLEIDGPQNSTGIYVIHENEPDNTVRVSQTNKAMISPTPGRVTILAEIDGQKYILDTIDYTSSRS